MIEAELKHLHHDVELIKTDLQLIKHILIDEGELTAEARSRLENARRTPFTQYREL